jgi:hypothetical protein
MPNHQPTETKSSAAQQRVAASASRIAERAEQAAERAHSGAIERVHEARERAETRIVESRDRTAQRISRLQDALRSAGDQLRSEDEFVAQYVDKLSDSVARVADYVRSADLDHLGRDVQRFARERPGVFFGGAFAVGLMLGRFLRSSAGEFEAVEPREFESGETRSGRELPAGSRSFGGEQSREVVTDYGFTPRETEGGQISTDRRES